MDELKLRFNSSILGEHYQILQMQSSAPDDGRKHRPKHAELTWNNKLIYIVHLVGYFHSCITLHGFMNTKFTNVPTGYETRYIIESLLREFFDFDVCFHI